MQQAELFTRPERPHPYQETTEKLQALARRSIYVGTSSWKYQSWWDQGRGPIYIRDYRNIRDFDQNCLEEYSRVFPAVSGDFSFYNWPNPDFMARINEQTPEGFKIALKATEFVTLKRFPNIERWGSKAGLENPDFLNAKLFKTEFLDRVAPLGEKLAPIILEFTAFPTGAFSDWTEFAEQLEHFFDALPNEFLYGVEIRTKDFAHEDFYRALKAMGAAPILNSWTRMPPLDEQWKVFEPLDFSFVECRTIMRPGRTRDEAVELYSPYDRIRERVIPVRRALRSMIEWSLKHRRPAYIFVNNHIEGCAHQTISELLGTLEI
jgi:uncharacterized protein YecE (DUF72 family)